MDELSGKVAVVTGGGRGMGAAICQRLAEDGAFVVVADLMAETAEECARGILQRGGTAASLRCDVSRSGDVEAMAERIRGEWGRVDVLVNNAGIFHFSKWSDLAEADFDRLLGVNLKGTWLVTRALLPLMRPQERGSVVNLSSTFAQDHVSGYGAYSAVKAAISSFTVSLAKEEARYGIRVNAVAPGSIDTDMTRGIAEAPAMAERIIQLTPLRRMGQPEEVAEAVAFLSTAKASFITGQVLTVSGGYVNPY